MFRQVVPGVRGVTGQEREQLNALPEDFGPRSVAQLAAYEQAYVAAEARRAK